VNDKILAIRSSTSSFGKFTAKSTATDEINEEVDGWVSGIEERGVIDAPEIPDLDTEGNKSTDDKKSKNKVPSIGHEDETGNAAVDPISSNAKKKSRRPRGGFRVEYKNMGADQDRATYTVDMGVFTVNLDHPLVKSAVNNLGIQDIGFQRLSHEIIFAEYALAIANMAAVDDPDIPADDVIYDARETLNRISAKKCSLVSVIREDF